MDDDIRIPTAMTNNVASARSLRRIADALGVPAASFYGPAVSGQNVAALLELVQAYFDHVDPETRQRFLQAVQNMDAQHQTK